MRRKRARRKKRQTHKESLEKMVRVQTELHEKKGYYWQKYVKAMRAAAARGFRKAARRVGGSLPLII